MPSRTDQQFTYLQGTEKKYCVQGNRRNKDMKASANYSKASLPRLMSKKMQFQPHLKIPHPFMHKQMKIWLTGPITFFNLT